MTELIEHLGIVPHNITGLGDIVRLVWAIAVLGSLFLAAAIVQVLSIGCHFAAIFWPQKSTVAQRLKSQFYWYLAILLMLLNIVTVKITGDPIDLDSALLMANHQSLADHIVLAYLAQTGSDTVVPQMNFFTWYLLWTVPCLRLCLNMFLCDENWELSRPMAKSLFLGLMRSDTSQWIVVFPEVNIWTPTSAYLQRLQETKYFLPQFDHLLYPRFPALFNAVSEVKSSGQAKFRKLYDVTITYQNHKAPTLAQFFASANPIQVTIHTKSILLLSIPSRRSKFESWLEKRWLEKDRRIATMTPTDHFKVDNA